MPRDKEPPVPHAGSAEVAAMVARTALAVVAALAGWHAKDDVVRTLMRHAVTGRVVEAGGSYTLRTAAGERGAG